MLPIQPKSGNTVASTGSTGSSYNFAATSGYRTDGDAGLMKVGCRYYDSQTGTFTSRDTYLDQKPYLYCEHDPVNAVDPSGRNALSFGGEFVTGGFGSGLLWWGVFGEDVPPLWPIIGVALIIASPALFFVEIASIHNEQKARRLALPMDPDPRQEKERNRDLYPDIIDPTPPPAW